ncbi:MAG: phosphonate ABC transporter, permease protein PhnE [Spirochaetes bacterium]|nr:phosphonate ABC transporter, permease protein PhnE [Spirochaetota bacterium]
MEKRSMAKEVEQKNTKAKRKKRKNPALIKKPESRVPGELSGLLSLLIPGLGHIVIGEIGRGFILFGSIFSMILMFVWRIELLAHLEPNLLSMYNKALSRRPVFILLLTFGIILLWLWNAWDAYRIRKKREYNRIKIFILVIAVFFVLGWQIGEINPYKMITRFPETLTPISRVLWPWKAAFTHKTLRVSAKAAILAPPGGNPPPPSVENPNKPYLLAEPTSGNLSRLDENYKMIPGTTITLTGKNFKPDTKTEIWWIDPIGNKFQLRQNGKYVSVITDEKGSFKMKVIMPYRLIPPSSKGKMIHHVEAVQVSPVGGVIINEPLKLAVSRMVETIFMGMIATLFGIILSIPVSFLAARNLMAGSWVTLIIYYITRTIINIIRSIEPLIWALIAVVWVGLGPFAGIIALTFHSIAALSKLYSEAIESIDPGPIEAIQATGATHLQTILYAVVPQMIPPFISFSIYRWDINVRMSTVIGLVGGGGIGFILVQYIRLLDYRAAGIAVWFIAITVALLDYISSEIRRRIV